MASKKEFNVHMEWKTIRVMKNSDVCMHYTRFNIRLCNSPTDKILPHVS